MLWNCALCQGIDFSRANLHVLDSGFSLWGFDVTA
jgi:hypothetical protein